MRVALERLLRALGPDEAARHAQVDHEHLAVVEPAQEVLAAARDRPDLAALQSGHEVLALSVPAHGARPVHLDALDLLAADLAVEVAAHDLHLRELGHAVLRLVSRGCRLTPAPPLRPAGRPSRPLASAGVAFQLSEQPGPGRTGGRLLGVLLRAPLARPAHGSVELHLGEEALGVVGALGRHAIARWPPVVPGRQLLQARLEVVAAGAEGGVAHPVREEALDEPLGGRHPAVEVDGGDHGFHGVGEDGGLGPPTRRLFALAEPQADPSRISAD